MKRLVLLIRHGQTTWNVEHRLPGQLPGIPLTALGREQAARLAEALSPLPISAIISSPLERAVQTADYLNEGRGLTIQLDPELMDLNSGPWAGQIGEVLLANDPARRVFVRNPTIAPPGVESFPELQKRVVAAMQHWLSNDSIGRCPAFVTHDDVIKVLLAYYIGLQLEHARAFVIGNASVSVMATESDHPARVLAISWSPSPEWLRLPARSQVAEADKDIDKQA
ncbi:MAG TPA: histidine phosphatase family protein [Ktedonobacteraceae bacterium]|nr:histidine phosphatase family protein [Ktedonobacteraceae bacterium]